MRERKWRKYFRKFLIGIRSCSFWHVPYNFLTKNYCKSSGAVDNSKHEISFRITQVLKTFNSCYKFWDRKGWITFLSPVNPNSNISLSFMNGPFPNLLLYSRFHNAIDVQGIIAIN